MSCDATSTLLASVRFSSYVCVLLFWSFQHAVDPLMRVPCFVRMIVCDADWMLRLACACACVCVQCAIHPFKLYAQRWQNHFNTCTHTSKNKSSARRKQCVCTVQFTHAPFGRNSITVFRTLWCFSTILPDWLLHALANSYRVHNRKRFANGVAQPKES